MFPNGIIMSDVLFNRDESIKEVMARMNQLMVKMHKNKKTHSEIKNVQIDYCYAIDDMERGSIFNAKHAYNGFIKLCENVNSSSR